MHRQKPPIVVLGLMVALAAMLQLGPVYWAGGGYLLAMAATLPVAVGAALHRGWWFWFFLTAAAVIGMFAPQEMLIFLMTTGPLGLTLGLLLKGTPWVTIPAGAGVLTAGMLLMPLLAGVLPWGGIEQSWSWPIRIAIYTLFALVYAALWQQLFRRVWARIGRAIRYTGGNTN